MPLEIVDNPPDTVVVTKSNGDAAFFTISATLPLRFNPPAQSFAESSRDSCKSVRSSKVLSKNCVVDSITLS